MKTPRQRKFFLFKFQRWWQVKPGFEIGIGNSESEDKKIAIFRSEIKKRKFSDFEPWVKLYFYFLCFAHFRLVRRLNASRDSCMSTWPTIPARDRSTIAPMTWTDVLNAQVNHHFSKFRAINHCFRELTRVWNQKNISDIRGSTRNTEKIIIIISFCTPMSGTLPILGMHHTLETSRVRATLALFKLPSSVCRKRTIMRSSSLTQKRKYNKGTKQYSDVLIPTSRLVAFTAIPVVKWKISDRTPFELKIRIAIN